MSEPIFKVGDVVSMRVGYSNDCDDDNYAGHGYINQKSNKYTIRAIHPASGIGVFGNDAIYFFEEIHDGVAEYALYNIQIERDNAINKLISVANK